MALAVLLDTLFTSLSQKIPPEGMVGRVDTMSTTFVSIFIAIGALAGGLLGRIVPSRDIFIYQGISYIFIGVFLILVPNFRRLPTMNEIKKQ